MNADALPSVISKQYDLVPPHSIDAEMCCLASMMLDPEMRDAILRMVGSESFFLDQHKKIFATIAELRDESEHVDAVLLRERLKRDGILDEIGGTPYIGDILTKIPSAAHGINYAQQVRDHAARRWLIAQMNQALPALYNGADPREVGRGMMLRIGEMVRRAGRSDRAGGAAEVEERLAKMRAGLIKNIDWDAAPILSTQGRCLESQSITVVCGSAGDGKTWWMLQNVIGWMEQGIPASVIMIEKTRAWHMHRCLALITARPEITRARWHLEHPEESVSLMNQHREWLEQLGKRIIMASDIGDRLQDIADCIDRELETNEIVVVDPISLAEAGASRYVADSNFIKSLIRTTERTDGRVILVTHPKSGTQVASLDSLAGGAAYQRATDSVINIKACHPPETYRVMKSDEPIPIHMPVNRVVSLFKGRNAEGGARKFAFHFNARTLSYSEQGTIIEDSN